MARNDNEKAFLSWRKNFKKGESAEKGKKSLKRRAAAWCDQRNLFLKHFDVMLTFKKSKPLNLSIPAFWDKNRHNPNTKFITLSSWNWIMGHVKQKKSTSSSTSTPPEQLSIEVGLPHSTAREHHSRSYPEQLNAEELISQINCRNNSNETTNDSNNNSNSNNNAAHRTSLQVAEIEEEGVEDVEKGPARRHRPPRPLYRRLYTFIRNLWIGAKFTVGKDGKRNLDS